MSQSNKLVAFIHIGKTGGLTLQSILASQFGLRHCDVIHWKPLPNPHALVPFSASDFKKLKYLYPNVECLSGHYIMPFGNLEEVAPSIRYFCFVRDPIRRMASAYQQMDKVTENFMSFEKYCLIPTHRNQQCRVLGGTDRAKDAIRVINEKNVFSGLMERFDESLVLLKALHIKELEIDYERRNIAPSQRVSNALLNSDKNLQLLKDANLEDQKLYDYIKDTIYPRYCNTYGHQLNNDVQLFQSKPSVIKRGRILQSKLKRRLVYVPAVKMYQIFYSK